ncbi:type II toxin-antitoxin system RelE/ParE family toxin [Ramlibacter sp. Leaf400]|uniref:type II toxin-antitoxin system RelE/ParE family toxin n=1 Tax=Ramlibacter sp. Leaf400 TaxID=1736365 RepID=UPI0006F2CA5C|nr:type II toxin-antitoxin system RelE/ParE family toxin [Ramlibacter sp. Leaf400]KQT12414.1 plasmid stabilization protein [Ramlibacter sp. Leaf400]
MTRVVLSAGVRDDFDRIFDFLFEHAPETAAQRIESIVNAINVLEWSPHIGRPAPHGQRELIISTGASGFLALYHYDPMTDTALVLAVRSQRERGYKRPGA